MRYFATLEDPEARFEGHGVELHVVAEYVGGYERETDGCTMRNGDYIGWSEKHCFTEEELLATEDGRKALAAWRAGDDRVHEVWEREGCLLSDLHDEQERAGFRARPDLFERIQNLREHGTVEEMDAVYEQVRAEGAWALSASE